LRHLHDYINLILVFIITLVLVILIIIRISTFINSFFVEIQIVEWVWTFIPAVLLLQIALPSLLLLYMLDERSDSKLTIKTIGHQWYWSYEYRDIKFLDRIKVEFDTYITPKPDINSSSFRLLDVDNRTVLPTHLQVRVLISSADVLHSWTVPSLGVKGDAVPGRLNQVKFTCQRPGVFFGQCSEICVRISANMNDQEIAEKKKKRTFRKYMYRGVDLDQLLDMGNESLMELIKCRPRRRLSRGLKRKHLALMQRLRKAKKEAGPLDKPEVVKTHLRNMVITPEMIGSVIGVYNGKVFNQVEVKPEMIGHYLGEFSITYKPVKHGRPGIGATHSSRFIPLK